jgi:hypothetical protein
MPSLLRSASSLVHAGWLAGCAGATGAARDMSQVHPVRAEQAPLVTVRQVVESDNLVGQRVRVAGACALAGAGPPTGTWVLQSGGFAVEVRGLVPRTCFRGSDAAEMLTIFAQIEPKGPDSSERLLLRLPE